ncbi:MAG: hypothetical protein SGPRY_009343 [Prymnesium sp.]
MPIYIPPQVRTHPSGSCGIANESDWDAKGDQPEKGQAHFGPTKAAQRMMQLAPRKVSMVQELAPIVALCVENSDLRLISEVAEYCAATDVDSVMHAVSVIDNWLSTLNCEPSA